jgi:protein tyrosine phosphatase (PTP) superfamily phosphohydrolase (DUF442 family)
MPAGRATIGRMAAWGIVLGLAAAAVAEAGTIFFGRNWHTVIPGQVYRSAQLSHDQILDAVHDAGIRTVVNLRGTCPDFDWFEGESRATRDTDACQEDVSLSACRLPAPDELRRLVDVIDHAEYPILLHCRQGVDRTGLASALVLLLRTDATPVEARRQLSLRYGHVKIGPTWCMLRFFDLYDAWLQREGRTHSPASIREWADGGYCPDFLRGRLELIAAPEPIRIGAPAAIHVRAINTSPEPWHLHPGTETGVHVRFQVTGSDLKVVQIGRAGQFEAVVPPGEGVDLTLGLAPLLRPGSYCVRVELIDGNQFAFSQFGNAPLDVTVTAGDPRHE